MRRYIFPMGRVPAVLTLLLASAATCLAQETRTDPARMEQVVQSFFPNGAFAGSILVARGDEVVYQKGSGRLSVASLTKQFTAAAILLLEERGKLRIDDPVATHLPSAPASWEGMTIFHLLTHTAGFAGLQTPPAQRANPMTGVSTAAEFIARLVERPLLTRPGEMFSYTNSGYFILGHLIERLSGQSYEHFIADNILTPVGLKDTGLDPAAAKAMSPNSLAVTPNAAAGFSTTAADLVRWQRALYGGTVISAASLKKMTASYNKGDYGLGIYVRMVDGRLAMTHGGGAPAFANLTWFPDRQISVVVLSSVATTPAPEIGAFLGALAHGSPVTLASERKGITLPPDVLARVGIGTIRS
jgi:CubicO group peptidase (beta-lactamase class C family)